MENNHYWYNNLDDEAETLFCNRNYYSTADWFSFRDGLVYIFKNLNLKTDVNELDSYEFYSPIIKKWYEQDRKFYSSRYTVEKLDW